MLRFGLGALFVCLEALYKVCHPHALSCPDRQIDRRDRFDRSVMRKPEGLCVLVHVQKVTGKYAVMMDKPSEFMFH